MISLGLAVSWDFCNRVDCSLHCGMSPYGLMVPLPKEDGHLLRPIKPFQPTVRLKLKFRQFLGNTNFFQC